MLLEPWLAAESEPRRFRADAVFDRLLAPRLGPAIDRAAAGALDDRLATPEEALASWSTSHRDLLHGTPRAFAFDAEAREMARRALVLGHHSALPELARLCLDCRSSAAGTRPTGIARSSRAARAPARFCSTRSATAT